MMKSCLCERWLWLQVLGRVQGWGQWRHVMLVLLLSSLINRWPSAK